MTTILHRLQRRRAADFRKDTSGATVVLFALMLVPILAIIGAGIDFSRQSMLRSDLANAADAAVLAAVSAPAGTDRKKLAEDMFAKAANQISGAQGIVIEKPTVEVDDGAGRVAVKLTFGATRDLWFGWAHKGTANRVSGTAGGAQEVKKFMDIQFLVDVSASMGLAAYEAGQVQLHAATGCAFACHLTGGPKSYNKDTSGNSGYDKARALGITLRIDVVRSAITQAITLIEQTRGTKPELITAGLQSFESKHKVELESTDNMGALTTAAAGLQLGEHTYTDVAVNEFKNGPGKTSGDGSSASERQQVMVLITDGVQSLLHPDQWHITSPMQTEHCKQMKKKGVTIAVLEIVYVPKLNQHYGWHVGRHGTALVDAMKECASEGLYAKANTPEEIYQAMMKIVGDALQKPQLTQ
jgi:Flp pilus assembly protein TadG